MDEQQIISDAVERFVRNLDVERVGHDWFVGQPDREEGRLFGGQVIGQAALAAGRTAPDPTLHSLHAYFLRAGRPDAPIEYSVERVRDGRTFTARRVLVRQEGVPICDVTVSFVHPEEGISHQGVMPEAVDPDTLQDERLMYPTHDGKMYPPGPFEWRLPRNPNDVAKPGESTTVFEWGRVRLPLPDDPQLHAAAVVYISDAGSFSAIERRYGWEGMSGKASASLDHAIWIHRPVRWDDWLLMVTDNPVANAARALSYRQFYTRDGVHVASVAQEAVFRRERAG